MHIPAFNDFTSPKETPKAMPAPIASLADLNVQDATVENYNQARTLLALAMHDDNTPLNQKAQVLNTINSVIASVIKQREAMHNVEQLKALEAALTATLKKFPALQEEFFRLYAENLGELL